MKKNDKIIVTVGVVILILASIGIYYWAPEETKEAGIKIENLTSLKSEYSKSVEGMEVSDNNPFYPLIVTPVAVHYDDEGTQYAVPLFVKNSNEPSSAVLNAKEQLEEAGLSIIEERSNLDSKDFSLHIAKQYWKNSDAVLLIQDNENGYGLGVVATPMASYLGIPIIVTDKVDDEVKAVLEDLGVTYSLVCGDLEGYGNFVKGYKDSNEIINDTIKIFREKFKGEDVDYITITNPRDAYPPVATNLTYILDEKGVLASGNFFPSHILAGLKTNFLGNRLVYTFKIPKDFKYALIKMDFRNLEDPKNIEEFGDNIIFGGTLTSYMRTTAYPAKRDSNGNIQEDRLHFETVLYDKGGEEFTVSLISSYTVLDSADYEITVTAEELSNPYYPFMEQFSSVAPYLASIRKGIVFAKPEFAFSPSDNLTLDGKTLSGNTQALYNPILIPAINQHVYENIHVPLNNLLAQIRDVNISKSVENLRDNCYDNPFYIALVGDSIMLPQYYFRSSHSDPFNNPFPGVYGTNVPSDYIYGNIDPGMYSLKPYAEDYLENDVYTDFPEVENVVGRIVGYDVQDASALITRTYFYDKIIDILGDWKNKAAVYTGAGTDMQKLPIITFIRQLMGDTEPVKFPCGEKKFLIKRLVHNFETGGFDVTKAERGKAQRVGYSTDAILAMKFDKSPIGLPLNLIFFPAFSLKMRQGLENINSLFSPKWWIETLFSDQSGVIGGELERTSNFILCDTHAIWFEKEAGDVMVHELGGPRILYSLLARYLPTGFRTSLDEYGAYTVRDISAVKMGPSVMMAEGCGSGKIDGFIPKNSLAISYLHAGVNAYISPTTLSAFYGALEPRFGAKGVGFGIIGYLNALINTRRGNYVPVYFNQFIFEESLKKMFKDDVTIGAALRDAKNIYLPTQFNLTFRWTPPLSMSDILPDEYSQPIYDTMKTTASSDMRFPVEKYATIYQINLLGDPAFDPYEPCNEGIYT